MPLTVAGLCKPCGAALTLASFRSNVSVWLGAPAIRMKITFCAVPLGVAPAAATSAAFAGCCARNDAVTPDPISSRKWRRVA